MTADGTAGATVASGRRPSADGRFRKHTRLKQQLREQIANLPPGTAIKSERALSEEMGASRTTVRQALRELAVEGRIVRMQGRGTFVAPPKVTLPLRLTSYTEDMRSSGRHPGSRLLDWREEPADAEVAALLEIALGTGVFRIERLRLADNRPMALEVARLEAERFNGLRARMGDDVSLYAVLREQWGVLPAVGDETIETVLASPPVTGLLETETGTPLLSLTRTTRDGEGRAFEFVRSLYRGDRYRFTTRLERPGRDPDRLV